MKKWLFAQSLNVIGIVNVFVILIMNNNLPEIVFRISIVTALALSLLSLILIVLYSRKFLNELPHLGIQISSSLSLVYRFVFPNIVFSMTVILIILGIAYDYKFFNTVLFFGLVAFYPTMIFCSSKFIFLMNGQILIYNYAGNYQKIPLESITKVKPVLLGFAYVLKYREQSHQLKRQFFFAKSSLLKSNGINLLTSESTEIHKATHS